MFWRHPVLPAPRILSEHLVPVAEPLGLALRAGMEGAPAAVAARAARALLDQPSGDAGPPWPAWLAPHQLPAAHRLRHIIARHGGAVLADEVGLGKSYVAIAVALALRDAFALVVPAILVPQWHDLLARFDLRAPISTHEQLSSHSCRSSSSLAATDRLVIVDEAHRFRDPATRRYRALARLLVGRRALLVSATPIHNRIGDLFHLLRLFLRDHALAALGIPSLRRAALGQCGPEQAGAVAARLVVARSRARARAGYRRGAVDLRFPELAGSRQIRASPLAAEHALAEIIARIRRLAAGGRAAPLLRLMLLRRLASSLPAFRASLLRHETYVELACRAAAEGRALTPREFQRCFPRGPDPDAQLALWPVLLTPGAARPSTDDRELIIDIHTVLRRCPAGDPKAEALAALLEAESRKTIVFTDSQATVRYLLACVGPRRVAALSGNAGRFARGDAARAEILRAFAPVAQGGPAPPPALETRVLIATDLLSEGLNLQDAARVIHYDLPWSPARLTQRVGRIDRLGSPHQEIVTITFLPPEPLAEAIAIEQRIAAKTRAQRVAGAAGTFDWCDELAVAGERAPPAAPGSWAAISGAAPATVLIVRVARFVEALVVSRDAARVDAPTAAGMLRAASAAPPASAPDAADRLREAIARAAPLVRERLAAVQTARWRSADRDRLARRLIPWVLSAARRAARRGDAAEVRALDALVSRFALGMTAGEELLLEDLLTRRESLHVSDLLDWHRRIPALPADDDAGGTELVAAVVVCD